MSGELMIYIDGKYYKQSEAKVSVFDHGLLYGDGVFEGIRAYNGRVFRLEEHIDRLYDCAKYIMLEPPVSKAEMIKIVTDTCGINNITDGYIRLVITRGIGDLGLSPTKCGSPTVICIATTITLYPKEMYENGLPVITSSFRRNNPTIVDPQIKSLNYLNNILAKIEANNANAQEAILLTQNGIVAECTGDNVFIVKDGIIYTPPLHCGILNGITRKTVIELAVKAGFTVSESEFSMFNLYSADECFLTGTAAECIAVTKVDYRTIGNGAAGPVTLKLLELFREYVMANGTPITKP